MKIDDVIVNKIAELSKLEFDANGKAEIKEDLNRILGFIDKLEELDTSKVEPLLFLSDAENVFRDDVVANEIEHTAALKNAPKKDSDYFRVPKVLNK